LKINRNKIVLLLFFLFVLVPLFARDVEITVEDTDLGLPLEGAVVRSWDGKQYTCNRDGKVILSVPDDRQVLVYASYPGYENGRLVVSAGVDAYTLGLQLSGIRENKELVIEASRPGSGGARTGRSITITERDIAQTGEIGIVEDVMSSIKLLPGVGYAGLFNALPSIRGGDPGDLSAALDGYYVLAPYHWGGGYSIFDPRMVQSAELSHGVFSARYGNTISGLLEITTKKPSTTETEFEFGMNTSAANFNLSLPLAGKGGILFMGRVTYYDPIVWLMKQLSHSFEVLEPINTIRVAPYIRSTAITGNYRFSDNLEFQGTGFWGMDGAGATYESGYSRENELTSNTRMEFDWTNYQGFVKAGFLWNPRNDMLLKFTAGTGYEDALIKGDMRFDIMDKYFSSDFFSTYSFLFLSGILKNNPYDINSEMHIDDSIFMFNTQGRIDYDWELGKGFLFAAGVQELFTRFVSSGNEMIYIEKFANELDNPESIPLYNTIPPLTWNYIKNDLRVSFPAKYSPNVENKLFSTSGYSLIEYSSSENRFNAELGLRVDHFYLNGKGFSVQSRPVLNPRLNIDFNVLEDWGILQSLGLSAGTGLFSSMNKMFVFAEDRFKMDEIKPNRSWTSIFGVKSEFPRGLIFNIEFYYKYVFDRTYIPVDLNPGDVQVKPRFDGEGRIWGIDVFLQKLQSRYWDGWLSYSFNWTKYYDPYGGTIDVGTFGGGKENDWYFPSYHRFHNLNLVLNFKPVPRINIYTRFGIASGVPLPKRISDKPISYPVYVFDPDDPSSGQLIEKYVWLSQYDENNRTTPSFPMDIKFSIFGKNEKGKAHYEIYFAVENVLALFYSAKGNTRFNQYSGKEDTGSDSANYEIPVPIPSFGFKISY